MRRGVKRGKDLGPATIMSMQRIALGVFSCISLTLLGGMAAGARAAEEEPLRADELLLKSVGLPVDGAGLVVFLRERGQRLELAAKLAVLVDQLGKGEPGEREKACRSLIALGTQAIPTLRQRANDPDAGDPGALARRCLRAIEKDPGALTSAIARLVASHRPEGAAEGLLACLDIAEDEAALEEMRATLAILAYRDDKPDPAILRALDDPLPLRRAAAIDALSGSGRTDLRETLRKLLQDPVPAVRMRAALALARGNDARAIGTLIALLGELPFTGAKQVEDFMQALGGEQSPQAALGVDEASRQKCRDAWAAWWQASEAPGYLDEFRKRTLTEQDRERGQALIGRLGDDDFDVRQKATNDLKALGAIMAPLLRQAANQADLEVRARAQACLESIEKDKATPLSPVVARVAALRKHPGSAAVMLAFLPFAEDENLREEVQVALNAIAAAEERPDAVLLKALEDKLPARRGAAAEALAQRAGTEIRPALKKLLADGDAGVRLKTALALAGGREREAIPVLIALVGETSADQSAGIEEFLRRLAGSRVPVNLPAGDGPARKQRQEAWAAWWAGNPPQVEWIGGRPAQLTHRFLGFTLYVHMQTNQVVEMGADGKARWTISNLAGPQDAQVLPGNRVLIAEHNAQKVTERNLRGDILWQKQLASWPIAAERLGNGNTFITCRNLLVEVDRQGREVFAFRRAANDLMSARKMRDGRIVCLSSNSTCFELDAAGKEVKNIRLQGVSNHGNHVLNNGNLLVPLSWQNKITEYTADGKVVWEASVQQPMSAWRLPSGNTLVATQNWPAKVTEIDRNGQVVADVTVPTYVFRAKRR